RFGLRAVRVIHRYGVLAAGEPIVLVMTAAAHRKPALQGCDYIMDWLKSTAPFWKLEQRPTGQQPVEARAEDHAHLAAWQGHDRNS
ncbi:MAG: molybdenum cofactor biosynthesis protein MoaE, partial [Alphaproteobacteria bacterium]|nr:molybdenum cofactor biosynthesis protein MoaE [Alphaproteobacteria bacterium]